MTLLYNTELINFLNVFLEGLATNVKGIHHIQLSFRDGRFRDVKFRDATSWYIYCFCTCEYCYNIL
jgi:hypothetical protein